MGFMKPLVVQKFGGTSVGSVERIRQVAGLIQSSMAEQRCAVVVSAMAGQTNRLIDLAREMSSKPMPEAFDMLVASGEQMSCALLCMALHDLGVSAVPLLGFQVGMKTDALFTNARIQSIDAHLLNEHIRQGRVPVIAGFQGVDEHGNITTLGRGGSDTSAVAIAVAIEATRCDIYTDVDGVYTADPRSVKEARKLNEISLSEMMELASLGAKVLHMRSVELAAKYDMPLRVRSTFAPHDLGTLLIKESAMLESPVVSALTADGGQSLLTIRIPAASGLAKFPARFFKPLAAAGINVDVIIEGPPDSDGFAQVNFTVPREAGTKAKEILKEFNPLLELENAVKVSIVGIGMRTHSGVAAQFFETLELAGIPIHLVTTSEITVSVLLDEGHKEKALQVLHKAFNLAAT